MCNFLTNTHIQACTHTVEKKSYRSKQRAADMCLCFWEKHRKKPLVWFCHILWGLTLTINVCVSNTRYVKSAVINVRGDWCSVIVCIGSICGVGAQREKPSLVISSTLSRWIARTRTCSKCRQWASNYFSTLFKKYFYTFFWHVNE